MPKSSPVKKKRASASSSGHLDGSNGSSDSRFDSMHTAPIFKQAGRDNHKVSLDDRFESVLTDDRFRVEPGAIDRYGRKSQKSSKKKASKDLEKFYTVAPKEERDGSADSDSYENGDEEDEDNDEEDGSNTKKNGTQKKTMKVKKPQSKEERLEYLNKLSRGEISDSTSGSSSGSDSSSDGSDDEESDSEESKKDDEEDVSIDNDGNEDDQEKDLEEIPIGDSTVRIAIQNCDWENIRAMDLMAVLQSFCPAGGTVKEVVVYPSDFGLEKMNAEQKFGPAGIWKAPDSDDDNDASDDNSDNCEDEEEDSGDDSLYDGIVGDLDDLEDGDQDGSSDEEGFKRKNSKGKHKEKGDFKRKSGAAGLVIQSELVRRGKAAMKTLKYDDNVSGNPNPPTTASGQSDNEVDEEALRRYELDKLKYYFAIAEFDSIKTADVLYEQVDGLEIEHSSMVFDLRFVPDEVSFEDRKIRDSCDSGSISANYKPPDFIVQALQHTNVECTWDEGDRERGRKLGATLSKWRDLQESDLQQYIASDSDAHSNDDDGYHAKANNKGGDNEDEDDIKATRFSKKGGKDMRKMLLGLTGNGHGSGSEDDGDDMYNNDDNDGDAFFMENIDDEEDTSSSTKKKNGKRVAKSNDDDSDIDQVFSFVPKAENGPDINATDETPFEKIMRKMSEKKRVRKQEKKAFKAGLVEKPALKQEPEAPELIASRRKELDMIFGDDEKEENRNHYDMNEIIKADKNKKKRMSKYSKKHKGADNDDNNGNGDNKAKTIDFNIDFQDDRFRPLLDGDSRYGIDPLANEYKETPAMRSILKEQKKRRKSSKKRGVDDQGSIETNAVNVKTSKKAKLAALKYRLSKQED